MPEMLPNSDPALSSVTPPFEHLMMCRSELISKAIAD